MKLRKIFIVLKNKGESLETGYKTSVHHQRDTIVLMSPPFKLTITKLRDQSLMFVVEFFI